MIEDAHKIFDYLPIRTNQLENEYITHLWSSIESILNGDESAQPFVMMPFHLLFMLSLQYKILRLSKNKKQDYQLAFTTNICRDKTSEVSEPNSVFSLSLLNESTLADLFKLAGVELETIKEIKRLVKYRNDKLAHANGGITPDPEQRIYTYLEILNQLQKSFTEMNNLLSVEWNKQIDPDEDINGFTEIRLAEEYLCPADFLESDLEKFRNEDTGY